MKWSLCEPILGLCSTEERKNLTVACMCRGPPSYFASACVWLDVAFDDAAHVLY